MTADVFGGGEDNNICSVFDGADKSDTRCIVNNKGDSRIVGDLCNCLEVRDVQLGVPDGLSINCLGFRRNCLLERFGFCRVDKYYVSSEFREGVVEELIRATIEIVCCLLYTSTLPTKRIV